MDVQSPNFMDAPFSYPWINEIHIFHCFLGSLGWLLWLGRNPWKFQKETLTASWCHIRTSPEAGMFFGGENLSHMHAACSHSGQLPGWQDTDFMVVAHDGLRGRIPALAWRWIYSS